MYYISKSGPLHDYGWFRSIKENKIVNKYGDPIPWFNYSMIEFLENRIKLNFNVFEYGSGSSTFWWAKRVNRLYSCEHDEIWFEKHKTEIMKENVDYKCKRLENEEYENYITNFKNYFDYDLSNVAKIDEKLLSNIIVLSFIIIYLFKNSFLLFLNFLIATFGFPVFR